MLLDENEERSILVTQPRRVAATSLARRVAQQRGVTLGTEVGFKIGGLVSNRGEILAWHILG